MRLEDKSKEELIAELKESRDLVLNLKTTVKSQQTIIEDSVPKKELQKAKKEIKTREKKYREIFENAQDIFYRVDNNGIISEISPSIERYSGYKPEEFVGKPAKNFYNDPKDRKLFLKTVQEKGEVTDYELQLKSKDGTSIYVSSNAHILFDSNKRPAGIEGSLRDITAKKEAEDQLIDTQNRLRVALDLSKMGSWEYDVASDTFTFDEQFYSLYGTNSEEQGGFKMSSETYASKFVPPEEMDMVGAEIERVLTTDDPNYTNQIEHSIIRADGEKRIIVVRNTVLKDENGKTIKTYGANQDITEQKMAEKSLKKSEEKYRRIFDNVQDVFYQTDLNGIITEISPSIERYSGFPRKKLIGNPVEMVYLHPEERPKMLKIIAEKGEIADYELKLVDIHNQIKYASVNAHPILDDQQQVIGIEGSLRDVTDRKIAEKALKESEERFRTIFENTGAATALYNNEGVITLINKEIKVLLQYSPEEIENKMKWTELVHPDDLPKMIEYHKLREKDPKSVPSTYETRFIDRAGKVHSTRITVDKMPGSDEYVTSVLDITDLKNTLKELEVSETRFKSLFENNPVPYQSLNSKGEFIDFNDPLSQLLGYPKDEIMGKVFGEFWSEETRSQFPVKFELLKKEKYANNIEIELITKNGEKKTVLLTARAQQDPKTGKFLQSHCILYDISERKLMEEKIKRSLEEKEMLLREIHHRVKNNLMVISSLLNLQSRLIKDKEALDVFKESQNRAKSMALIHERLYRSSSLKKIDFGDYIRTLSSDLFHTYVIDAERIDLELNIEKVMIDINTAVPLGLIVNELVTNSMKYAFPPGKSGKIEISFKHHNEKYTLRVKDNGVGIPDDVDISQTKTLGLQLVTSLSEQIDAEIELNRENGTDFKITFEEIKYD